MKEVCATYVLRCTVGLLWPQKPKQIKKNNIEGVCTGPFLVLLCEVVISSLIMMKTIWLGPKAPFPLKKFLGET